MESKLDLRSLGERLRIIPITETAEFKKIENMILESHSQGRKKIKIYNLDKTLKVELLRQGFNIKKKPSGMVYKCGCKENSYHCYAYNHHWGKPEKRYKYIISWTSQKDNISEADGAAGAANLI